MSIIYLALTILFLFASKTTSQQPRSETLETDSLRIAFLTDCTPYSAWQSVAMAFTFRQTRQPGSITRIMCCTQAEREQLTPELLDVLPTHIANSYTQNDHINDYYQAYNKPGALYDWLWLGKDIPKERWIMVVDSDMYVRRPLHPILFSASKGWAVSNDYTYLDGVSNELWTRHIPHIGPRNDTLAGPMGRHADQVGGWLFIDRDDLKKVSPQWLSITEAVRADPEAWRLCGDHSVKKGERPWISEMYGYVFSAANNSVYHTWDTSIMKYPTYTTMGVPKIIHYGLKYDVQSSEGTWSFDKHWFFGFNVSACAPWDLGEPSTRTMGIFKSPPRPRSLLKNTSILDNFKDLIAIETVATLNAGFCYFHLKRCPAHPQLLHVCREVLDLYIDIEQEVHKVEVKVKCADLHVPTHFLQIECQPWAERGECSSKFSGYMSQMCRKSCGLCNPMEDKVPQTKDTGKLPTEEMAEMLQRLAEKLQEQSPSLKNTGSLPPSNIQSNLQHHESYSGRQSHLLRGKGLRIDISARKKSNIISTIQPQVIAGPNRDLVSISSTFDALGKVATETQQKPFLFEQDGGLSSQSHPTSWHQFGTCVVIVAIILGLGSRLRQYQKRHLNNHVN